MAEASRRERGRIRRREAEAPNLLGGADSEEKLVESDFVDTKPHEPLHAKSAPGNDSHTIRDLTAKRISADVDPAPPPGSSRLI